MKGSIRITGWVQECRQKLKCLEKIHLRSRGTCACPRARSDLPVPSAFMSNVLLPSPIRDPKTMGGMVPANEEARTINTAMMRRFCVSAIFMGMYSSS